MFKYKYIPFTFGSKFAFYLLYWGLLDVEKRAPYLQISEPKMHGKSDSGKVVLG